MPFDKEALTAKWHGVPVYGWVLGGGLVLGLGYRWYKNRTNPTPTTATDPSTATPSSADSSPTSFDTGLPWAGGAPGDSTNFSDLASQIAQNASDVSGANAAINAANQQQASDNAATQSSIMNMAAAAKANADALAAQRASDLAATNAAIAALASVKPTPALAPSPAPSQANTPATQATPGIGPSVSSYLPPATIAAAAKKSTAPKIGKPGNSGVHAQ